MCRHVVTARVVDPEGLKTFTGANGEWAFERVERENGPNGGDHAVVVFAARPTTTTTENEKVTVQPLLLPPRKRKKPKTETREAGRSREGRQTAAVEAETSCDVPPYA